MHKFLKTFWTSMGMSLVLVSSSFADEPKAGRNVNVTMAGTLPDPSGMTHGRLAISGKVGVVIFSVPDMSLGPSQKRWSKILADESETRLSEDVGLTLVENMALAGAFRDKAMQEMKKQFLIKKRPFLLLDETGSVFKRFGILRDRTEILIFDRKGNLRDVESNLDNRDQVVARIKRTISQERIHP